MARVANDGEVGAQVGSCDRLLAYAGASRGRCVAVDGLALTGGVEVFSDAVGVDNQVVTPAAVATATAVMGCPVVSMALSSAALVGFVGSIGRY